jgi:hypothetical protein
MQSIMQLLLLCAIDLPSQHSGFYDLEPTPTYEGVTAPAGRQGPAASRPRRFLRNGTPLR